MSVDYKAMSKAGFFPVGTDSFIFRHRGLVVDLILVGDNWLCYSSDTGAAINIDKSVPLAEMAETLRQFLVDTAPMWMIGDPDKDYMGWISAGARNAASVGTIPFSGELDANHAGR